MAKISVYELLKDAEKYAPEMHALRNLEYSGLPYGKVHLQMVVNFANYFRALLNITIEEFYRILIAAWCHDLIEDCGVTYSAIEKRYGKDVADWVWAVTGFGRNRKERNSCIQVKVQGQVIPTFIKMCDKLANTTFSKFMDPGSGMYGAYFAEWPEFKFKYELPELKPMFDYYDNLLNLK